MRKKIFFLFFTTIPLFWLQVYSQQRDGSVFERRITIQSENQPLSTILGQLSWQARVFFSYDASIVDPTGKYTVKAIDKSLYTILNQLFNADVYILSELDNQIIISKKKQEYNKLHVPDSVPEKYFFLSGKVVDRKRGNPLQYATVSVVNKPIGTITNADGEFILKLKPQYINDTLMISNMGYSQIFIPANRLLDEDFIFMDPVSIRIREVKVTATTPEKLLQNIRANINKNYSSYSKLMNAFYRETVKQDENYISISEAVIEILKAPYNSTRSDLTRLVKGRQSSEVQPFKWMNFKLQGGPFTITQLDVVKTFETFIDEKYEHEYVYKIPRVVWYNDNPVYVLEFKPAAELNYPGYYGELYVHRETFAIVYAHYRLNRNGLKQAAPILVKHTPPGVKAQPSFVEYHVNYQKDQGTWHLLTARANIKFAIRSRQNKVKSEFQSISELLITNIHPTELKKFNSNDSFSHRDILVDLIGNYDPEFWENYNIIKPDEELKNALHRLSAGSPNYK